MLQCTSQLSGKDCQPEWIEDRKQQEIMYAVDSQECDLWTIGAVPSFPFCAKNLWRIRLFYIYPNHMVLDNKHFVYIKTWNYKLACVYYGLQIAFISDSLSFP